eukprot:TRINITY_DN3420_c0_g2_i1.p1 TRINITY_DN3420_c0_g2~~TRINITY_DN3420_c0_g2_i1.p1  ORF type:complete len:640 (-),score=150.59 TRINITY_DN3420_c0_g2_i1:317-2236(-)
MNLSKVMKRNLEDQVELSRAFRRTLALAKSDIQDKVLKDIEEEGKQAIAENNQLKTQLEDQENQIKMLLLKQRDIQLVASHLKIDRDLVVDELAAYSKGAKLKRVSLIEQEMKDRGLADLNALYKQLEIQSKDLRMQLSTSEKQKAKAVQERNKWKRIALRYHRKKVIVSSPNKSLRSVEAKYREPTLSDEEYSLFGDQESEVGAIESSQNNTQNRSKGEHPDHVDAPGVEFDDEFEFGYGEEEEEEEEEEELDEEQEVEEEEQPSDDGYQEEEMENHRFYYEDSTHQDEEHGSPTSVQYSQPVYYGQLSSTYDDELSDDHVVQSGNRFQAKTNQKDRQAPSNDLENSFDVNSSRSGPKPQTNTVTFAPSVQSTLHTDQTSERRDQVQQRMQPHTSDSPSLSRLYPIDASIHPKNGSPTDIQSHLFKEATDRGFETRTDSETPHSDSQQQSNSQGRMSSASAMSQQSQYAAAYYRPLRNVSLQNMGDEQNAQPHVRGAYALSDSYSKQSPATSIYSRSESTQSVTSLKKKSNSNEAMLASISANAHLPSHAKVPPLLTLPKPRYASNLSPDSHHQAEAASGQNRLPSPYSGSQSSSSSHQSAAPHSQRVSTRGASSQLANQQSTKVIINGRKKSRFFLP